MRLACSACGHELPPEAEYTLVYCAHCGAPQLLLGADLQDSAEAARLAGAEETPQAGAAVAATGAVNWPAALRLIALSGAVMLLLSLLAVPLPALGLLSGLWFIASPVVVMGVYGARTRGAVVTAGLGARVGLLTGLANLLGVAVLKTAQFDLLRHAGQLAGFDAMWTQVMQQSVARAQAMSGDTAVLGQLSRPEFRIAWILASFAMFGAVLLVLSTLGGAFSGLLRTRQGQRAS